LFALEKRTLKTWQLLALGFGINFAAFMFRATGSFAILFFATGIIFFLSGFLFQLRYQTTWWTATLLLSARLVHDLLGLFTNQDLFPIYIPAITLVAIVNLLIGLKILIPSNLKYKHASIFFWLALFSFLSYEHAGKMMLWDSTYYDLPYKVEHYPFTNLDGSAFDSETLRGKIVLLDFWSFNCGACFRQFPEFEKIHNRYQNDPDVIVLAVHGGPESLEEIRESRHIAPYSFPVVTDPEGQLFLSLGLWGVPQTVLIDPNGNVVLNHQGYSKRDEERFWAPKMIKYIEAQREKLAKPTLAQDTHAADLNYR
jgi:thiol-disulfide isomerase/thioredoxin